MLGGNMKNRGILLVSMCAALVSPSVFAQGRPAGAEVDGFAAQEQEARALETARKTELAGAILAARQAASGRDLGARLRASLTQTLVSLSVERLEAFLNAGGLGDIEAAAREGIVPSAVGDPAADLAFTPVPPCRVVDTRFAAAGILAASSTRNFLVRNAGGFAVQGGSATDCGIPPAATAVEMNFVAVNATGPGDLRAYAFGGTLPGSSVINYASVAGLNIANGIAQPVCNLATTTCTQDLSVLTEASNTHLIVDVVGYFNKITLPATVTVVSSVTVTPGNFGTKTSVCPAAFPVAIGGGVDNGNVLSNVTTSSGPLFGGTRLLLTADGQGGPANGWYGGMFNNSAALQPPGANYLLKVAAICSK
jgi:hypothetical protein